MSVRDRIRTLLDNRLLNLLACGIGLAVAIGALGLLGGQLRLPTFPFG